MAARAKRNEFMVKRGWRVVFLKILLATIEARSEVSGSNIR